MESNDPVVVAIMLPAHQAGGLGPVHEAHRAVVSQQQVFGDIPDRRTSWVGVAAHCKQQLVLRGRKSDLLCLLLAPAKEAPQPRAELEQALVVGVLDVRDRGWHKSIV